jgi:hypothetical protein
MIPRAKPQSAAPRSSDEVREYESRVWDLTKHLVHPAFLYVVFQVALWCALERNPAFRGGDLSFWEHAAIHAAQFVGAWGVFYGTLLRDMRFRTRVVTAVLWLAAAGAATAWLWPAPESVAASPGLWALLIAELAAGIIGWMIIMASWLRAKARHAAERPEAGHA